MDLKPAKTVLDFDKTKVAVGAQNVHWEPKGAFTGEVSVAMIKEIGCACSIVGHSERRELFGETNEDVNRKVKALVSAGLYAVVCVGESLAVREEGTTEEYVTAQVRAAFAGVDARDAAECVVAYEPIWAIGDGPHGHARAGRGRVRGHPRHARGAVRRRDGRRHARFVRRLHERGQRGGAYGPAEHRRRPGGRREPGGGVVRAADRGVPVMARADLPLPACLVIMDGFGLAEPGSGNAISQARTPVLDALFAERSWDAA